MTSKATREEIEARTQGRGLTKLGQPPESTIRYVVAVMSGIPALGDEGRIEEYRAEFLLEVAHMLERRDGNTSNETVRGHLLLDGYEPESSQGELRFD